MANKYGETDFSENVDGNGLEMILEPGKINTVRLITNPFKYLTHKIKVEEDTKSFGWTVKCADKGCPECKAGNPVKPAWWIGIIDRGTNTAKVLKLNALTYKGIKALKDDPNWKDPMTYDINIKFNKGAKAVADLYSVVASPIGMGPLSAEDIEVADTLDKSELVKRIQPITPEQVESVVAKYHEWVENNLNSRKGKRLAAKDEDDNEDTNEDQEENVRPNLKFRTERRS